MSPWSPHWGLFGNNGQLAAYDLWDTESEGPNKSVKTSLLTWQRQMSVWFLLCHAIFHQWMSCIFSHCGSAIRLCIPHKYWLEWGAGSISWIWMRGRQIREVFPHCACVPLAWSSVAGSGVCVCECVCVCVCVFLRVMEADSMLGPTH